MRERKPVWAQLPAMPKDALIAAAQSYESANLEGVWSPQMFGAPFAALAAAAAVTDRLKLGTGIALAFTRSPLETVCDAINLDLISNGRAVLGLGSSAQSQIEGSFGMAYGKPLAHMREIVGIIRAVLSKGETGELKELRGEYHTLDLSHFRLIAPPPRRHIPIYLPAVFENACVQAGEIADGLLGHPLWNTWWVKEKTSAHLKRGLDKAGRARAAVDLNLMVFTVISDNHREAIEDARPTIAYYSQSPQYFRYFEEIGFGREAAAIQDAFAKQDYPAMIAACSDAMVESVALVGDVDRVRRLMAERAAEADSITPVIPHYGLSAEKSAAYAARIAEVFYG